jgi:tetratricopeptide (TPR) repeat protein
MSQKGERGMSDSKKLWRMTLVLAATLLGGSVVFGQAQTNPPANPQANPPAQGQDQNKPANQQAAPLSLDSAPPPVSAEEEAAFKGFDTASNDDPAKKSQLADEFLQKYPQSRYRGTIYSWQVRYYFSKGQIDQMEAAGDKELELIPNDVQTLAIVGSALPRAMNANTPDPQKRLAKAEQYSQKSLDLLPTMTKPEGMSDEQFLRAKNMTSALAYSGLGLVAFRRGKFDDAIPNFQKSVQLDPQPDPVNYYLLGLCNEKTSHFDEAATNFSKCADIPGGLQATCKQGVDEAKKAGATQLSAPK